MLLSGNLLKLAVRAVASPQGNDSCGGLKEDAEIIEPWAGAGGFSQVCFLLKLMAR